MGDAREAHWLTRQSLRGRAVSGPVSEPRTHANQTRPTTHMQPAADCGQRECSSDPPRLQPTSLSLPTSKSTSPALSIISQQSSVASRQSPPHTPHTPHTHHTPPSTSGRTQVAGPGARAWCLDPGSLLDPDWDLGRLKIGTANTSQRLSKCTQSQSEFACNISFVGCCRPIATTLPSQHITARLDLYASSQPLSKPSPIPHPPSPCPPRTALRVARPNRLL